MTSERIIASLAISLALHAGGLSIFAWVGSKIETFSADSQLDISQILAPRQFEEARPRPARSNEVIANPPPSAALTEAVQPAVTVPATEAPVPPKDPEIPLGIEDSKVKSETWKGSAKTTENLAPKSQVDQAARAIDPKTGEKVTGEARQADAVRGAMSPRPEASESSSPAVARQLAEALPTPAQPPPPPDADTNELSSTAAPPAQPLPLQPEVQQKKTEQLLPPQREAVQPLVQQVRPQVPDVPTTAAPSPVELAGPQPLPVQPLPQQLKAEQLEEVQPLPQQPQEQQLKPRQADEPSPLTPSDLFRPPAPPAPTNAEAAGAVPPQSPPQPQGAAGASRANSPDAQPGRKSEEESPAASIAGSLVYKPGEPLAGKGLRVLTVRPQYGITTLMTAAPKNATTVITFGRDGRVIRAAFKDGKGTGYEDVDKPLLEAVYRWTARGEALATIPADQPRAGVTFEIKFLMER